MTIRALPARALAGVVLALLPACSGVPSELPDQLTGVPDRAREVDRMVEFARDRLDRGEPVEALRIAEALLGDHPDLIDAHRLRQDILRERGRQGLLLAEAQQRLTAEPRSAAAHYLRGRLAPQGLPQRPHFERAVELDAHLFWGWLGLASSLRRSEPERALDLYRGLAVAVSRPVVLVNLANVQTDLGRHREAVATCQLLRAIDYAPGVGDLGLARSLALQDERAAAWAPLLAALRARPFDSGVRALLEGFVRLGLPSDRLEQIREVLYQDPGRLQAFVHAGGGPLLAEVFARLGAPQAAREALGAGGEPPADVRQRRLWRRAMLAGGDVSGYLADLRAHVPTALLVDERNQLRGLWRTLLDGAWFTVPDPLADAYRASELVVALRDVGLLPEADQLATVALARTAGQPGNGPLRERRDELRRLIAFEGAVRRILYAGYVSPEARGLRETLDELRRVSKDLLAVDVVGEPRIFSIPLVGDLLDPFGPGLPQHFARYNRHLVLGQRKGMPSEGILLTRLSLRDLEDDADVPVPVRAREVVAEDRSIDPHTALLGGDIAGFALVDNYVIDMDAVRDWARGIARMRRIGREDGMALLRDPLPMGVEALDPLDTEWRLALLSPEPDDQLDDAVLDMIRWHERAHLSDTFYFLPPESNLGRVLGMLLRNGLRATGVEADLERRAELAALAKSKHVRLVMAHIAGFCGQDLGGFSPHASGFERLAQGIQQRLREAGLSDAAVALSRWHELDPAQVQAAAKRMLARLW